jgi:hypothetical protein
MADTKGALGLWRERCSVRSYEWVLLVWSVLAGGLWGGFALPLAFEYPPSNFAHWIALWPVWLDLQLHSRLSMAFWNPILESSIVGAAGACIVAYVLLTIIHIREEAGR